MCQKLGIFCLLSACIPVNMLPMSHAQPKVSNNNYRKNGLFIQILQTPADNKI
jgi:hypothetical protein